MSVNVAVLKIMLLFNTPPIYSVAHKIAKQKRNQKKKWEEKRNEVNI